MPLRTLTLLCALSTLTASAQESAPPSPSFEVASIKPADPSARGSRCSGGPGTSTPGQWSCTNCPLAALIMEAHNLNHPWEADTMSALPRGNYDIVAKVPPGTTSRQMDRMVMNLLAGRFGLVVDKEPREMPLYELVVGSGGPKLKAAEPPPQEALPGRFSYSASSPASVQVGLPDKRCFRIAPEHRCRRNPI